MEAPRRSGMSSTVGPRSRSVDGRSGRGDSPNRSRAETTLITSGSLTRGPTNRGIPVHGPHVLVYSRGAVRDVAVAVRYGQRLVSDCRNGW